MNAVRDPNSRQPAANSLVQTASSETKAILKEARSNGTIGLAPNGQLSLLPENRWAEARTKSFKDRFGGNWELVSKLAKVEALDSTVIEPNNLTEQQAEEVYQSLPNGINRQDSRIVRFVYNTFGKLIGNRGFDIKQIIPQLATLFDESLPIYSEEQERREGHKWHSNLKMYHNYLNKITLADREYFVRLTVQELHTRSKSFNPNEVHNVFISAVGNYKASDSPVNSRLTYRTTDKSGGIINAAYFPVNSRLTLWATDESSSLTDAKLRRFFESARLAREKFAGRLDINGEPFATDPAFESNDHA